MRQIVLTNIVLAFSYPLPPHSILSTEERQLLELKNHAPFKARPVDQRVLSSAGDLGVPRVKKATTTVAHSPHITKTIKQVDMAKPASPVRIIKANAYVMHKPFQPKIEHRLIKPAQFKLPGEELSARRKQQIEEKKQREEQEMARQRAFKAQPMIVGYEEV